MWKRVNDIDALNANLKNTLCEITGMRVTRITDDALYGEMPVDHRTHQPMGLLHGGASAALAESLGSIAANQTLEPNQFAVGLEITASHVASMKTGSLKAEVKPEHLGSTIQLWTIRMTREDGKLVSLARLTMAVREVRA